LGVIDGPFLAQDPTTGMMIRAMIISAEQNAKDSIESLLQVHCLEVAIIAQAEGVKDARQSILSNSPELVFLDIMLKGGNAFDLLKSLQQIDFKIIFTAADNEYAVQAFRFSAVDFLMKPIDAEELKQAVAKVSDPTSPSSDGHINNLIANYKNSEPGFEKIAVPTSSGFAFIKVSDIVRCDSDNNYVTLYFIDGKKLLVTRSIKEFEEMLFPHGFFRVHKSHLVNLHNIKEYSRLEGGYLIMADDQHVKISRRKREEFLGLIRTLKL